MTPHEQIIADHETKAAALRLDAEGKRAHAKGHAQTAAVLDAQAEAHQRAADVLRCAFDLRLPAIPAPAPVATPPAPPPEALMTDVAATGAGNLWEVRVDYGTHGWTHDCFHDEAKARELYEQAHIGATVELCRNGEVIEGRSETPAPAETAAERAAAILQDGALATDAVDVEAAKRRYAAIMGNAAG